MMPFSTTFENTNIQLVAAIHALPMATKLLRKSNIRKAVRIPAFEVFQFLLLLVFQGKNLFRFLQEEGLATIGMIKQLQQRYLHNDNNYTLPQLRQFMQHESFCYCRHQKVPYSGKNRILAQLIQEKKMPIAV